MIESGQVAFDGLVSCDCSWPLVQIGVALDVDGGVLSVSRMTSFIGGGWVPSAVRTLPAAVKAIGVYLLFESAFGVTPLEPSNVTFEVAGTDHRCPSPPWRRRPR